MVCTDISVLDPDLQEAPSLIDGGMMSKVSSPGADFPGRAIASSQYSEKDLSSCARISQLSSSLSAFLDSSSSTVGP